MVSKRGWIRVGKTKNLRLQKNAGKEVHEGKSGTFRQESNYGCIIPECKNKKDLLLKPFVKHSLFYL